MNKTYKWKIPKNFYVDEEIDINYHDWLEVFSGELYSVVIEGLREKLKFSYHNYGFSQDDCDYTISFDEKEAFFVVNFLYKKKEAESIIFEVFISALKLKKIFIFYRKSEPSQMVFEKFHDAVIEIAKEHNIVVFDEIKKGAS